MLTFSASSCTFAPRSPEKKRNWNVGIAFVSFYLLFFFCLFYGADEYSNAFQLQFLLFMPCSVLYMLTLCLSNLSALLPEIKTPFSVPTALLSLVAPTHYPFIIL